jgi:hypothetical protein
MARNISMKFGIDVMPLEAITNSCFFISHNRYYKLDGCSNLCGGRIIFRDDVIAHDFPQRLMTSSSVLLHVSDHTNYQWSCRLFDITCIGRGVKKTFRTLCKLIVQRTPFQSCISTYIVGVFSFFAFLISD